MPSTNNFNNGGYITFPKYQFNPGGAVTAPQISGYSFTGNIDHKPTWQDAMRTILRAYGVNPKAVPIDGIHEDGYYTWVVQDDGRKLAAYDEDGYMHFERQFHPWKSDEMKAEMMNIVDTYPDDEDVW